MANAMTVLVILLVTVTLVTCQTFQYSRGWTTGKRADAGAVGGLPTEFKMNFPTQGASRRGNTQDNVHCGLRKLRMLLRGNVNDQGWKCSRLGCPKTLKFNQLEPEVHRPSIGAGRGGSDCLNFKLYHLPCELLNILPREEVNQRVPHDNTHHLDLYDNDNYDDNN